MIRLGVLFCTLAAMASAAVITRQVEVSCNGVVSNTGSCEISTEFLFVNAEAEAGYTLDRDLYEFTMSANASTFLYTNTNPEEPGPVSASAEASASIEAGLRTFGPPRGGFIDVFVGVNEEFGFGFAQVANIPPGFPGRYDFQLGVVFSATAEGIVRTEESGFDFITGGGGGGFVSFRLYEADGVTPVEIHFADEFDPTVPEPATFGLSALALAALTLGRKLATSASRNRRGAGCDRQRYMPGIDIQRFSQCDSSKHVARTLQPQGSSSAVVHVA